MSNSSNIKDYDYELPQSLIAQVPAPERDHSRLLVVDRSNRSFTDSHFFDLPALLRPGDLIVVNDTRVAPARLFGRKESGGKVEILVLEHPKSPKDECPTRSCLLKSSRWPKEGTRLLFESNVSGCVKETLGNGLVKIEFSGDQSIDSLLEEKGKIPLPPYITREKGDLFSKLDKERYQTVFSATKGAVAAPTAGLHFTGDLIEKLEETGISITSLTLHVGYGTFRPVRTADIRKHFIDEESYRIEPETVRAIERTRKNGGRVVAVGTTVVRALETAAGADGVISPGGGKTGLLITPGFCFKIVDSLITNFHLPKSSLLFLVAAFGGNKFIQQAYDLAVKKKYRFYSYGDAMLIL